MIEITPPKRQRLLSCIDFFAGIGAWELASEIINQNYEIKFKTIQFIEIDINAQKVLRSHYPNIPIHPDVKTYQPTPEKADVYFISFPCTGTSNAGKRTGLEHPESSLWYESLRCICFGRPKFVVVEQPEGFVHRGLRAAIAGLRMAGYQTEIELISAAEFGAPHQRNRVFIIAHANHLSLQQRQGWGCWNEQIREHIAIARSFTNYPQTQPLSVPMDDGIPGYLAGLSYSGWWKRNPAPVDSGVQPRSPGRREAINLIGRSIVPLQAAITLMRVKFLAELLA
ncbi:DNA cytosine methyltransferase [Anabaena azotica]|uniref:DNA (cytosine-5-)-methyltransferase n=1 Tax=Anabaena azotica FACHB-119 TaxID=947527 RepID=A0ABR8CYX6_9NOST|nr:DNA cytosine methyltransferase [Anabaena azotica]MBD2499861.1 DNA cytosine methyltransferase [Anabaena azotica FACHB-119]